MIYDVKARRLELSTLIDLKAQQTELVNWLAKAEFYLPDTPNTSSKSNGNIVYWIGDDHWLLRTSIDREDELSKQLNLLTTPDHISAVIVSDTLEIVELIGAEADQIISIACPLDIHQSVFPENGVTLTEAFGLKALLIRIDNGFELAVDRSYGDVIQDFLTRAGASFDQPLPSQDNQHV